MAISKQAERDQLLAEIAAIPQDALPAGDPARAALCALAQAGCDVSVYQKWSYDATGQAHWQWVVWLRPAQPDMDGRHLLDAWRRDYAGLTADALDRQRMQQQQQQKGEVA